MKPETGTENDQLWSVMTAHRLSAVKLSSPRRTWPGSPASLLGPLLLLLSVYSHVQKNLLQKVSFSSIDTETSWSIFITLRFSGSKLQIPNWNFSIFTWRCRVNEVLFYWLCFNSSFNTSSSVELVSGCYFSLLCQYPGGKVGRQIFGLWYCAN